MMCGISGFIDSSGLCSPETLLRTVDAMTDSVEHRGPDDRGVWLDSGLGVALGHRRLSILDLSPAGAQPMHSHCGRYVIVFNGEIYNHRAVRAQIEAESGAIPFRGHSDTEVMLAAFSQWGVEQSLKRFNGMFAFAVWDREVRELWLARDRMGEKPLYYTISGKAFLFGSELKALRKHPSCPVELDLRALALYLRFGYVPGPWTIYNRVYKLPPACFMRLSAAELERRPEVNPFPGSGSGIVPRYYWSPIDVAERCAAEPFSGSEEEAIDRLEVLLREAVKMRMEADVPLGAFLSGGIDSSTIVALMQAQSDRPVRTFSIGFLEEGMNEAHHAKQVARHLGTDHVELYVTPTEALDVIPMLPAMYDEPFADASQIPTFLVSRLARQHVTVSLSGDGGDELFFGYERYHACNNLWDTVGWVPRWMRALAGRAVAVTPVHALDVTLSWMAPFLKKHGRVDGSVGQNLRGVADVVGLSTPEEMYRAALSHWRNPGSLLSGNIEPETAYSDPSVWPKGHDLNRRMMYLDAMLYLPDDILVKVDRASMAVSLESRVPLLDHRVVEFAWSLGVSMKMRNGEGKLALRQVLYRYVPRSLVERPKMGFGVPIDAWLRGPLRDWAENLLDESRLKSQGILAWRLIRKTWAEHLAGLFNRQYLLWTVLMFQAWLEANKREA